MYVARCSPPKKRKHFSTQSLSLPVVCSNEQRSVRLSAVDVLLMFRCTWIDRVWQGDRLGRRDQGDRRADGPGRDGQPPDRRVSPNYLLAGGTKSTQPQAFLFSFFVCGLRHWYWFWAFSRQNAPTPSPANKTPVGGGESYRSRPLVKCHTHQLARVERCEHSHAILGILA